MDSKSVSITNELHFHRVFMRTNRQPSCLHKEPKVNLIELKTFVTYVFDHALFLRQIADKFPPLISEEIKKNSEKTYFNFDIGDAVVHHCAIKESFRIAVENGFDEKKLLSSRIPEQANYMRKFIRTVLENTRPVNISFIYALAFAVSLCGMGNDKDNYRLMCIAAIVVSIFYLYFPYEWMYYDFELWAFSYMFRHKEIHS